MSSKKIVCVGAASKNFTGMYIDMAARDGLKGSEVVLYDIDNERLDMSLKFVKEVSRRTGSGFKVKTAGSFASAMDGADFVISDIGGTGGGGGGFHAAGGLHKKDLMISSKYGIYQVVGDTAGPAAMMAALRTIPIYLQFTREMEKRCPDAVLVNHANPMAVLCRTVHKYTSLKQIIGLCHGVQGGINYAATVLDVKPEDLYTLWVGTNHYYWFTEIYHKGMNVYSKLMKKMEKARHPENYLMHAELSRIFKHQIVYPDDSHIIEFYPFLSQLKNGLQLPYGIPKSHHGREVISELYKTGRKKKEKELTRKQVLKDFAQWLDAEGHLSGRLTGKSLFEEEGLKNREGILKKKEESEYALSGSLGSLLENMALGRRRVHIVNVPNKGMVPNLPENAILEIEGVTHLNGIRGVYMGNAPLALKGQLEKIIAWQEMVVDAAVKGEKNLAMQALMLDPMAIIPASAEKMLDELLNNSRHLLPQFFKK
jgi:alpha-galactosidase